MIEEKILGKCASSEVREKVARGLRDFEHYHSERRNILSSISFSQTWIEVYVYDSTVRGIAEVLQEEGISTFPEYSLENEKNSARIRTNGLSSYEFFVASDIARRMLDIEGELPWTEHITLNKLYEKTFPKQ
jgi:hypothetical protein